jgi:hypothetical protein
MSIIGSIHAEYGNEKRKEWLKKLENAYSLYDWDMVETLIAEMKAFRFSE